jgi:uncharacterized protein (TIGR00255 family)
MTRSMTAFARAEHGAAIWELRSVNHRYLDISFRMPDNVRFLESALKGLFKDQIHRGKIECSLKINNREVKTQYVLNEALISDLSNALEKIAATTGITNPGTGLDLLRWPDVLQTVESDDDLAADVTTAFSAAVTQMVEMRGREGDELAALIESRLQDIKETVELLRTEVPAIIEHQHSKLKKRLNDIDVEVDPSRLEQELVIQAQKLDVTEELDRLVTHVLEVRRNLSLAEPVGRRLDFLMQELNREANTLSSKAAASTTTLKAVDLKVVIEQMREQIQNIE